MCQVQYRSSRRIYLMENVVPKNGENEAWVVFRCVVVFGPFAQHRDFCEEPDKSRVLEFSAELGVEGVVGGEGGVEEGGYVGGYAGEKCGDVGSG